MLSALSVTGNWCYDRHRPVWLVSYNIADGKDHTTRAKLPSNALLFCVDM